MRLLPERLDIRKNRTVWNKEKELVDRTEHVEKIQKSPPQICK
jgi:hypothetical protein